MPWFSLTWLHSLCLEWWRNCRRICTSTMFCLGLIPLIILQHGLEYCSMVQDPSDIMSKASMNLVNWGSNSPDVSRMLQHDFRDKFLDAESHKVLGLTWLARDDCFMFHGVSLQEDICVTKRVVLSYFPDCSTPWVHSAIFFHAPSVCFRNYGL